MNLKINIFTKKRSSLIEKSLRFHIVFGFDRKIYQVFWRENTTEKKVCAFVMCLVLIEKIYSFESFGGKNISHCAIGFLPLKVKYISCFNIRFCSNSQQVFSSRQPSIRKIC